MSAKAMKTAIIAKQIEEYRVKEKEKREREKKCSEIMEDFKKNLSVIDEYVERMLLENNGKAEILLKEEYLWIKEKTFYSFANKDYNIHGQVYWQNVAVTSAFPLNDYVQYLQSYGYTVNLIYRPFQAYSSTGKSSCVMDGFSMQIFA